MDISKSVIFQAAHTRAKNVHIKGDNYSVTFAMALKLVYADMKKLGFTITKSVKPAITKIVKSPKTDKELVINSIKEALQDDGNFKTGDNVSSYNVTFMQLLDITKMTGSKQLATLKELKKDKVVSFERVSHGYNIYLLQPY